MIILLNLDAGPPERAEVRAAVRALGLECSEVQIGERTALVAERTDDGPKVPAESLGRLPYVDQVVPSSPRDPLVRATRSGARTVRVGSAVFGGSTLSVIAGPCTVEDSDVLGEIARYVRDAGAVALRGGAFKVRTSPHNFQGGGLEAFDKMVAAARGTGLPFFTELNDPRQVELVADRIEAVQIGARHMQNFPLLQEAARLGKPILLKRHMSASLDEWMLAAEYILDAGNDQVILCERGLRTAEKHVRFMLDVGAIPYLRERTGLPIVVDPSHAAGHHRLVAPLARAAVAAGADGLLIEVHPRPETTRCDAMQALPPASFRELMQDLRAMAQALGRTVATPPATPLRATAG